MQISFYHVCLLIIKDKGVNFGIIRFHTDNTFNIRTEAFMNKKEAEIINIKLKATDFSTVKLFVFIDEFFTNNKDQNSQISYIITIENEYSNTNTNEFTIKENLSYLSSITCKRVI